MTPERFLKLRTVLDRRQPDLTVLMDNVHKPHNFSAVLRTCDAVGVYEAHGVWPHPELRPHHQISSGIAKWVKIRTHPTLRDAFTALRASGFLVYAAHASASAHDYRDVSYTRPVAILLGAELHGLSDQSLALADAHVAIPMMGFGGSLNVSVAAATILFEAQKQRLQAGFYARPRLAPDAYARTLFEWAHPDAAERYRRAGRSYPPLDETGNIIDRSK
ncbi:MAG: tRNA (guanosine(18)-2'-O)-methyltransferase TrmH [Gammaproteobacteria bacterium]|nr:tRNA (guanosine(18)-2'-O)-methyltransferase TrmH [Gammaproteobacteria bacterium]NIR82081.1 tRNA (guanosine(18)-2'-O)-methyltransferase TrmH [Gammaproteobacteria bacterium]NIR89314.1 tRNA (guanosine(18)-2'-O)-methyltransferase TrmH [Gammaproteobacteria bacterium]NIU03191.1 tRNA (guanosine(18)-2'-O)-methyltransferase TrmH [Gammaproteobacteria bacterium]NIV50703.1 tRNA (guanosine(18)-2'-O)-methyltransferase TrmH [Gammaproteobacteria bacterium]